MCVCFFSDWKGLDIVSFREFELSEDEDVKCHGCMSFFRQNNFFLCVLTGSDFFVPFQDVFLNKNCTIQKAVLASCDVEVPPFKTGKV